jgi:hypothetical protein
LSLVILVHKARVQALGLETFLDLQSCWLVVQFVVFVLQRPLKSQGFTFNMIHDVEVGGLTFDASFDSGNAARVEAVSENANEFALWTARDCENTIHENGCRTWFSFSVRGAALFEGRMLAFRIHNMNSQGALYKHDMRPVFRALPSQPVWERLPLPATYSGGTADKYKEMREKSGVDGRAYDGDFSIRFEHIVASAAEGDTLYFAFCFPESYTDVVAQLAWLDSLYDLPRASVYPPGSVSPCLLTKAPAKAAALAASADAAADAAADEAADAADAAVAAAGTADAAACTAAAATAVAAAAAADNFAIAAAAAAVNAAATDAAAAAAVAAAEAALPYLPRLPRDGTALTAALPPHPPNGQAAAPRASTQPPNGRAALELSAAAVLLAQSFWPTEPPPRSAEIYYHRELLTRSLDGRRCVRTCTRVCMLHVVVRVRVRAHVRWHTHACSHARWACTLLTVLTLTLALTLTLTLTQGRAAHRE